MNTAKFGIRLKEVRKSKNITQDEMATMLGTTKQVLSRYERGERTPKITVAAEYASKLNVNLCYLLGEDAEMNCEPTTESGEFTKEAITIMQMWKQIPEESQAMVYTMIEAALKSRGL